MTNRAIYNEIEPFAAQWLKNLMVISARVRGADSACDRGANDRSGKEPRPSLATCNSSSNARRRVSAIPVYEQRPTPESLRTTHMLAVQSDSSGESGRDCYPAISWTLFSPGKSLPVEADDHETCESIVPCSHVGSDPSRAIYCPDRRQSGIAFRRHDIRAREWGRSAYFAFSNDSCRCSNSIDDECASPATRHGIRCSEVAATCH